MLNDSRKRTALSRATPPDDGANISCGFASVLRQAYRFNGFRKIHRLSQLQQSDVVIVRVLIEAPMSDDGRHCPLDRLRLGREELIVIAQNDSDFVAFQSAKVRSLLASLKSGDVCLIEWYNRNLRTQCAAVST